MIWLLACTKTPVDSGVEPTECGRLSEYPGTDFSFEAHEWPEGRSLYGPEPPDQVHDDLPEWQTFLDVHGRSDPVEGADWEGRDVLLWVGGYDACDRRTYDWVEGFVVGEARTILGFYEEPEGDCPELIWEEAWVFLADEVEGAPEGDVCSEPTP